MSYQPPYGQQYSQPPPQQPQYNQGQYQQPPPQQYHQPPPQQYQQPPPQQYHQQPPPQQYHQQPPPQQYHQPPPQPYQQPPPQQYQQPPPQPYQQPPPQQYQQQPPPQQYHQPPPQQYQQPPPQPYQQPPPQPYQQPPPQQYQQPQHHAPPPPIPHHHAPPPPAHQAQQPPPNPPQYEDSSRDMPSPQQNPILPKAVERTMSSQSQKSLGQSTDSDLEDFMFDLSKLAVAEPETHATVLPYEKFDPEEDAKRLRKAMKGLGCDKTAVWKIVAKRSTNQRQRIKLQFKTMYGKDLTKMLHSELSMSSHFRSVVLALFRTKAERDAQWIREAISGVGTDERCLIDILVTRTAQEIKDIRDAYSKMYEKDLEADIKKDTSGHFKRLLVSLAQGNRPANTPVNEEMAKTDAQRLLQAGVKRWGTDESTFNAILCSRSFPQLRATFREYNKICKYDILRSIKREMSGDLKSGMLAIAKCVINQQSYFATRIYKSMKGLGTNDRELIRNIVSRCEVDMVEIKQEFMKLYGKPMSSWVKGDTSGYYESILLCLIGDKE